MARAEVVIPDEVERIRELSAAGRTLREICALTDRSRWTVRRALAATRAPSAPKPLAANFLQSPPLAPKIGDFGNYIATNQLSSMDRTRATMLTPDKVQTFFIEPLGAHFSKKHRNAAIFFSDLTAALVDENVPPEALMNAARELIRTRTQTHFPSVAICIATCRRAAVTLADAAATPSSDAPGMEPVRGDAMEAA